MSKLPVLTVLLNLPALERHGLAYTVSGDGTAHVGTDPAARADTLRHVPAFLAR